MATKLTKATTLLDYIIDTLVESGQEVTLGYNKELGCRQYDLNVGFKSGIKLSIEDSEVIARMRYNGREVIKTPLDLLEIYDYWFDDATSRGWGKMVVHPAWAVLYGEAKVIVPVDNRN